MFWMLLMKDERTGSVAVKGGYENYMSMHVCREVGDAFHGKKHNRTIKKGEKWSSGPLDGSLLFKVVGYFSFKNSQTLICSGSILEWITHMISR